LRPVSSKRAVEGDVHSICHLATVKCEFGDREGAERVIAAASVEFGGTIIEEELAELCAELGLA
jgi:hypothetical protein